MIITKLSKSIREHGQATSFGDDAYHQKSEECRDDCMGPQNQHQGSFVQRGQWRKEGGPEDLQEYHARTSPHLGWDSEGDGSFTFWWTLEPAR